ncbi:sulfotransferase [Mesorhizobium waimense]|uniref:Sulfotransferase n=1 Tax=Mesorhizobium waimense TaxID=1300307 RepID=A0A3A5K7Q8_9HYPH|nr:sulfotransferase [Mesorhizobium waimense]RJT28748.1 sulfotransferase [Mesorhizobium waimense]
MSHCSLPFKLILVTGCMRSGTSLLHRLVSTSPDTGERLSPARFIADFLQLVRRYGGEESAFATDYFLSREEFVQKTRQFVEARLHDAWVHSGKPNCLVLRTVEIAGMLPLVADLLPDANFAISVREPKDTITSILNVGAKQTRLGIRHGALTAKRDVARLCKTYNRAYLTALRKRRMDEQFRDRIVFVRYEDAVADPAAALRQVWDRFGLRPGSGILPADPVTRTSIAELLTHRYWRSYRTDLSEAPVSARSVGSYRSMLRTSEIYSVDWRCRMLRRAFGYSSRTMEI